MHWLGAKAAPLATCGGSMSRPDNQAGRSKPSKGNSRVMIGCLVLSLLIFVVATVFLTPEPASTLASISPSQWHKGGLGWTDGTGRMPALADMGVTAVYHLSLIHI